MALSGWPVDTGDDRAALRGIDDGSHGRRLPIERIDKSVRRIFDLKTQYNAGPATGDDLDTIQTPEQFRIIAAICEADADRREQEELS